MPTDTLFLDTAYIYGLFNTRDQWHEKAVEWQQKIELENYPLITTEFVLTEIANGLSAVKFRRRNNQSQRAGRKRRHERVGRQD